MKIRVHFYLFALIILVSGCQLNTNSDKEKEPKKTAFEDPPEWVKEVVWYQIFPERFRNGDTTNDPTPKDIKGCYPGFVPDNWDITPWTHDWYKHDVYFAGLEGKKAFGGHPINNFGQKAQLRRYGGDLQGILDKMNYLDSLGVTAVYFNPLNDAPSLHKYDARHWRHIDRNFGPDPKKDAKTIAKEIPDDPTTWQLTEADKMFLKVIDEFHKRGIKVIMDYSWNHTGHTFWAWKDLVKNQETSKYADWYWVKQFDDPKTEENEFDYRGWFGVPDLPEIRETVFHDHADGIKPFEGDIYNKAAKEHIFNVTKRWMDPNGDGDPADGVDGFRLDVAAEVPFGFWREYRKLVRELNPDAFLLGEVWWEKWPDKLLDPEPFVKGDIFDAPMNYRWYRAARHFFNASPNEITVSEFIDSLNSFRSNLRKQTNYAMMNIGASHDAPRVLTSLFNRNQYKKHCQPGQSNNYKIHKPDDETYQTLKMLLAHQFTYIGAPHIWAGDEMGMWGADDPSTRKPLIWPDYEFEPETTHPLNAERPTDKVKFNDDLFNFYRDLIKIRKEHPVLTNGEIDFIKIDDENKVLAYSRYNDSDEVIAIFNASSETKNIEIPVKFNKTYLELLKNGRIDKDNKLITVSLPGRTSAILFAK